MLSYASSFKVDLVSKCTLTKPEVEAVWFPGPYTQIGHVAFILFTLNFVPPSIISIYKSRSLDNISYSIILFDLRKYGNHSSY